MLKRRFRRVIARPHRFFVRSRYSLISDAPNKLKNSVGLLSLASAWLSSGQLEAIRKSLRRVVKKRRALFLSMSFCYMARTAKPALFRMGKGRGKLDSWHLPVTTGKLLCSVIIKKKSFFFFFAIACCYFKNA